MFNKVIGIIIIIGVLLGLIAFILHFTNKKYCKESINIKDIGSPKYSFNNKYILRDQQSQKYSIYNVMKLEEHIFMGHDGNKMENNTQYYFTKYFDWVFMKNKIIKKNENPKTCYIKLDYLNKYINDILSIKNNFILVSGCSDYSPSINFKKSYKKIIKLPNLIKYYAENNLSSNPKMCSLTVGLATHSVSYENELLDIRKNIKNKKNKIFSCFRNRVSNVCGKEFIERPNSLIFIDNNKKNIEHYNNLNNNDFLKLLSQYKWCFCPLGNGVDHSPKLLECLILKVIPICKKNLNSYNLYKNYPIIWIDDFNITLKENDLKYSYDIDWDKIISEFHHKYIFNKIFKNYHFTSITNKIYCFWTGNNKMSQQRQDCLDQLREVSKCNVILVTPKNLNKYILKDHPLHDGYQYLSQTHKADYLRTYFMRFHGGGYSDIKKTTGSWIKSFEKLKQSDKWIIGYKETPDGVAVASLNGKWRDLLGNCAYICKPNTRFVIEWYNEMIKLMDEKYDELKKNPAKFPQDRKELNNGYPIEWNEMLGRIFHKILYQYRNKQLNTLPICVFENYR